MKSLVKRTIDDATVEELKQEIKKREAEAQATLRPVPLKEFNMTWLIVLCERYLNEVLSNAGDDTDTIHYIFEEAMSTVYGRDFWERINKLTRER